MSYPIREFQFSTWVKVHVDASGGSRVYGTTSALKFLTMPTKMLNRTPDHIQKLKALLICFLLKYSTVFYTEKAIHPYWILMKNPPNGPFSWSRSHISLWLWQQTCAMLSTFALLLVVSTFLGKTITVVLRGGYRGRGRARGAVAPLPIPLAYKIISRLSNDPKLSGFCPASWQWWSKSCMSYTCT